MSEEKIPYNTDDWLTPDGFVKDLCPPGSWNSEQFVEIEERQIERPPVRYSVAIIQITLSVLGAIALFWLFGWWTIIPIAIYIAIRLKAFIIFCVLLYQRFAPEDIRRSCLFTPSCSEYMILSLKKYGTIKGTFKGLKRLFSCHYPNGGEDYP